MRMHWREVESDIWDEVEARAVVAKKGERRSRQTFVSVMRELRGLQDELRTPDGTTDPREIKLEWAEKLTQSIMLGKGEGYAIDPLTLWMIGIIVELAYRWWLSRREEK